jgi:adenylate kinase family enzyme
MRWEEYTTKTAQAIDCYRGKENFFRVDGDQPKEEVFAEICNALESLVVKQSRGL